MAHHNGSMQSPIVISDDEEDAAFVDQQLQFEDTVLDTLSVRGLKPMTTERGKGGRPKLQQKSEGLDHWKDTHDFGGMQGTSYSLGRDDQTANNITPSATRKRKGNEPAKASVPPAKKQKKKKKQQNHAPSQMQSSSSMAANRQGLSTSDLTLQQCQGAEFNSYDSTYGLGGFENGSMAEAFFQAQAQLPMNPLLYAAAYYPAMFPLYQQHMNAPSLPMRPTYEAPPPVPMSFDDGIFSMSDPNPNVLSGANCTPLRPRIGSSLNMHIPESSAPPTTGPSQYASNLPLSSIPPNTHSAHLAPPSVPAKEIPAPLAQAPSASDLSVVPPSTSSIGMAADSDPASQHGLFKAPKGRKLPKMMTAQCAIVMEAVPRIYRRDDFVKWWSQDVTGVMPIHHIINDKGKVLIVFQSPELARKAFDSPRLKGGRGEEGIRVWWYRDSQSNSHNKAPKTASGSGRAGGAQSKPPPVRNDLEEGEIEEVVVHTRTPAKPAKLGHQKPHASQSTEIGGAQQSLSKSARKKQRADQLKAANGAAKSAKLPTQATVGQHMTKPSPTLTKPSTHPAIQAQTPENPTIAESSSEQTVHVKDPVTGTWSHHSVHSHSRQPEAPSHPVVAISATVLPLNHAPDINVSDNMEDMDLESPVSLRQSTDLADERHSVTTGRRLRPIISQSEHLDDAGANSVPLPQVPISSPKSVFRHDTSPSLIGESIAPTSWTPSSSAIYPSNVPASLSITNSQCRPVSTPTPPMDTPSEPRAMKSIPKGPRSLLERAKELEQRLARSRNEMARPADRKITSTVMAPSIVSAPIPVTPDFATSALEPTSVVKNDLSSSVTMSNSIAPRPAANLTEAPLDELSREENLRRLVLQSRKAKVQAQSLNLTGCNQTSEARDPTSSQSALLPGTQPSVSLPATISNLNVMPTAPPANFPQTFLPVLSPALPQGPPSVTSNVSLDDIAISFINDAIQAAQVSTPTPSLIQKPSPLAIKIELAAKQKKLEQHITESKMLIAKLNTASTKVEKENLLSVLRERRRSMDEFMSAPSPLPPLSEQPVPNQEQTQIKRIYWPESSDNFVLTLSDDEDDEEM